MSDSKVSVIPDSTGKNIDTSELTQTGGVLVERQRINISDPVFPDAHAVVTNVVPIGASYGLAVRDVADQVTYFDREHRRTNEYSLIAMADGLTNSITRRSAERINQTDRRGNLGRGSTR